MNVDDRGAVQGGLRVLLRAEGAALFAAATAAFFWLGNPWWLFLLLILAPDLSLLGYLRDARTGAAIYNAVHSTIGPIFLVMPGLVLANAWMVAIGLIWAAHAGMDRAVGYGLKYGTGFGYTHLGTVGRQS